MDIWEKITKTVSEAADYTAREASKLTGIAKLKYKISAAKARLDNLYASLGRLKYDELKGNVPSGTTYDELVAKIDKVKEEIDRYENELAELKNERLCISCHATIGIDMAYCPRCGAKQPEPEKKDEGSCCCNTGEGADCCCGDDAECCEDCCDVESDCCESDTECCCDGSGTCETGDAEDGSCCCEDKTE